MIAAESKQLIVGFEDTPCLLHGDFAEVSGCGAVCRPDEERATNQALQSLDLRTDRRLTEAEALPGLR
ncbi:hypothetical protein [Bradyrhizobium sp. I1.14.4]|uniref:hypothetical protein n=1 Tax=unclassified Bradyrhizobium TaxID=2631580 RepID=UPI003D1EDD11